MTEDAENNIEDLEQFLGKNAFQLKHRSNSLYFGNKSISYRNPIITVDISLDRSAWSIEFSSVLRQYSRRMYDAQLLRDFFMGTITTDPVPLADQIEFIKGHFADILRCFSEDMMAQTLSQLDSLGKERAKRMFSGPS